MNTNREIEFYVDAMVVECLLSNPDLYKKAQSSMVGDLISKVKQYFDNHIDPDDKGGSVLNMLAPGAISMIFKSMNLGWLGVLISMAVSVFNINVAGALSTIYNQVKSYVTSDKKMSSSQVQSIVDNAVQENNGPIDEEEAAAALANRKNSMEQRLKDANWLKLAMIAYDSETNGIRKEAKLFNWGSISSKKAGTASILSRVLGFIFKIALSSAGFLVAGDVVNKLLGRPNALDNTMQHGQPVNPEQVEQPAVPTSTQTKFKAKPGADTKNNISNNWIENVSNTESGIENMVIGFAKEAYEGLDSLDSVIRSSSAFNKVVNDIAWYNHASAGAGVVFIPKNFISKKQLVDYFIDEVASKAP